MPGSRSLQATQAVVASLRLTWLAMNNTKSADTTANGASKLLRRLIAVLSEALHVGNVNDSSATEVGRLRRLLDQSSLYVADDAVRPQVVQFHNGRAVRILTDERGPYLDVSFVPTPGVPQPPTPDEQAALDRLHESNFLQRLVSDSFDVNR